MKHKETDCCVNCRKVLPKGEFVVLNGGALRKTKGGGATIDRNLEGFLHIVNHFDSKKNYRSFFLADETPDGQFNFCACSLKCLKNYFIKQFDHMEKLDKAIKARKFEMAPTKKIDRAGPLWINKILSIIGFRRALVTDESTVGDFISFEKGPKEELVFLKKLSKKLGFTVIADNFIWELAEKYKKRINFRACRNI